MRSSRVYLNIWLKGGQGKEGKRGREKSRNFDEDEGVLSEETALQGDDVSNTLGRAHRE